ncbi:efflux RND transporter periplasmic adaptor subunit [Agrobacterium radiobacter]|uniref:efflux RND transporter periplasmic adaptor subunit n=1 Tax=Agrobacterium radiobacter TaxID=362 RepID=UPI0004CE3C86|nr:MULTISPECIES: efflux RND transporter periplasmic adaptor subunit [Agrobacterium tumefaciens complex]KAB0459328.1 efflux RND transporter periplasmic adaptor subunit [Agrobacterium tumefaciens]KWT75530.1 hemolysin secretion protein D [Agrobacterium radiobacter]NIB11759.1 efflux RND transporter periplasmic adaptor subunit [Agrobacterium radiobacter]OOO33249.1 efflux transporter periplasmic adaptor subunit [Agrobacterium radiobacter]
MKYRSIPFSLWLLACSVALTSAGVAQETSPAPQVVVAKPVLRDVVDRDEFIGRFQAAEEVQIRARVGGYLQAINFRDGQLVKEGDQLFEIDQRPFLTALSQAQATLAVATAGLTYAQAQFDRVNSLVKSGSQTISTLDDRRRELDSAQANVQGAQATLDRANLDLTYSRITAPLGGRIDRHQISVGNLVQADQTLLTSIVMLDPIDFYFDIDERRLLNYAETARKNGEVLQSGGGGLKVSVTLGDRNRTKFQGTLDFAENRVDPQTGTLRARARFANPDFALQPGLFGRVELEGSNSYQAVLIPDEAISSDQDERVVFVVGKDNTVSTKAIRPGPRIFGYRVVRSGLDGTESIIVRGVVRVRPGMKVDPKETTLPSENNDSVASAPESASASEAGQ